MGVLGVILDGIKGYENVDLNKTSLDYFMMYTGFPVFPGSSLSDGSHWSG